MASTYEHILVKYDAPVRELALRLREFLLKQLKGVTEQADVPANMVAYGYGPGYKDMICTIIPSKKGVKLGFYKGSELPDPTKLLTGSGKVHKYVEIKTEKDVESAALKALLAEAFKSYKARAAGK
jgi:hypothetical protein